MIGTISFQLNENFKILAVEIQADTVEAEVVLKEIAFRMIEDCNGESEKS